MAITEIRNLTNNTVTIPKTDFEQFDNKEAFSETITATIETLTKWNKIKLDDNIQVTWDNGDRAVGGTVKIDKKEVTISGLILVSKISMGLNGQIKIAPKTEPDPVKNPTAVISVRMGNIPSDVNPNGDWLIDLSDKQDGATGTSVRLDSLITWIGSQTGDDTTDVAIPQTGDEASDQPKLEEFTVEFNQFHFNITQKTFDIDVSSKKGQSLTFGNFTIENVGFRLTNEPISLPATPALPETPEDVVDAD
jgi:hypothetical protein